MLRYSKVHGVYNGRVISNDISNFPQSILDDLKSSAMIMNLQSLDVLKEYCYRSFFSKNFRHIEEECTASFFKASFSAGKRKCLTRKTCTKYIKVIRNVTFRRIFGYISKRHFTIIGKICLLCLFVPFG